MKSANRISAKSTLIDLALKYLKKVATVLEAKGGKPTKVTQYSEWMVRTGPTSMSGKRFTREVSDIFQASFVYQSSILNENPPEQQQLIDVLVNAGIALQQTRYGYLMPLVHRWLKLEDPFAFDEAQMRNIFYEFSSAVLQRLVVTKSRYAILSLNLEHQPVSLERGVCIRPISKEELWELGDTSRFDRMLTNPIVTPHMLGEDWNILAIEIQHQDEQVFSTEATQTVYEAVITALALVSPGHLQFHDLGVSANFGMGSTGTLWTGRLSPKEIGRRGGPYVLDQKISQRLESSWPHLRKIMEAKRHDLRIPAQRLLIGGERVRMDDAIIDYAIGLEALLLKDANTELSYRFALRGANILALSSGEKERIFDQLRDFYDIRSKIVHGKLVDTNILRDTLSNGEKALRDIWWWCFTKRKALSRLLKEVDNSIIK